MKLSRWLPPILGIAVFLVTLVGLGLVVGDWTSRNLEMRALVGSVEDSESAMKWTDDQIQSIITEYGSNGKLNEAQKTKAWNALSEAAYAGEFAITASGDVVAGVTVLPWHGDIKRAQDAYVAHNAAWQDYMKAAVDDPTVLFKTQPEINSTFDKAQPLMEKAVPIPALFDLKARVAAIFAPQPGSGSSPGGPTQEVGFLPVRLTR
ncbi:MAG: hypothetical protein WC005_10030 [Candidatus Nanopelagicales bacterium]